MFRLIADDHYRVIRVLNIVVQMMDNTSRFAHARSGDDHTRSFFIVQCSRFFGIANELQALESENVVVAFQYLIRFIIEAFGVFAEDLGRFHRERAVNIHRQVGQQSFVLQIIQLIDKVLRSADTECRNDDLAAAVHCSPDNF